VPDPLAGKLAGKFIVFDGPDGGGKSAQRDRLAETLAARNIDIVRAKDPGGTEIGDRIRHILLNYDLSDFDVRCETFLFMASRAQLAAEVIEPALKAGRTVLCDRYVSATVAYQGAAGYDPRRVIELARFAVSDTFPHLTLVLDVAPEIGFERTGRSVKGRNNSNRVAGQGTLFDGAATDAMESRPLDFHRKVRHLFLNLPGEYPGRIEIIDAARHPDVIHQDILEVLERADF